MGEKGPDNPVIDKQVDAPSITEVKNNSELKDKLNDTKQIIRKGKDLLDSVDPDFSSTAKEEFRELKSKYENAKKNTKIETEADLMSFKKEISGFAKEFKQDIKGINSFEKYASIAGYKGFAKFMESDGLQGGKTEEKLFRVFAVKTSAQINKSVVKFPNSVDGVKEMLSNIDKGVDVKKVELKTNITEQLGGLSKVDITELDLKDIEEMKHQLIGYLRQYGKDSFLVHCLVDLNKVSDKKLEYDKAEEAKAKAEEAKAKAEEAEVKAEVKVKVEVKVKSLEQGTQMEGEVDQERKDILRKVTKLANSLGTNIGGFPEVGEAFLALEKSAEATDPEEMKQLTWEAINKVNAIPLNRIKSFFEGLEKTLQKDLKKKKEELQKRNISLNSPQAKIEIEKLGSYKNYDKAYSGFTHFSDTMEQKMVNIIPSASSMLAGIGKINNAPDKETPLETWQIQNTMGIDLEKSKITGDRIYEAGDSDIGKGVDTSDIPKQAFMMNNKTGFRLNIPFPKMPEELKDEHEELSDELLGIYEKLRDVNTELRELIAEHNLGEHDKTKEIQKKQKEIGNLKTDLKTKETAFKTKLDSYNKRAKQEQKENEEKAKKILHMTSRIGLDRIPQHVIRLVIETINVNPASYGFNTQIDLDKGVLGFNTSAGDTFWDKGEFDIQDLRKFTDLFSKAIGNPDSDVMEATDVSSASSVIKDEGKFIHHLNKQGIMGITGATTMLQNLKKKTKN